jgi:peptidyl-prolyl cis-trans isomerase SurA
MTIQTVFILGTLSFIFSCKTAEHTIVTVDEENTTSKEFKYVYEKNHAKDHDRYSRQSLDNYLDLYINYRLKVAEAEYQKLDTSDVFTTELNGYKTQLAKPYLTDETANEKLALEAYQRSKTAIKAQHLLIRVDQTASAKDTLIAYNKIEAIRDSIVKGKDFTLMATKYSEDPSAQRPIGQPGSGGELGYFTALKMVYAFENAAYNTEKGEISKITRTKFGYHILKVNEKYSMTYKAKVSHIMINAPTGISSEDSTTKKASIDRIYLQLQKGADWNELCQLYSEHTKTKDKGGSLEPFAVGGSLGLPSFEVAAYELKAEGEISKPVKTPYGWHIIRLEKKVDFENFAEVKKDYIKKISRDDRAQQSKIVLVEKLKADNKFKEVKNINAIISVTSNTKENEFYVDNLDQELFRINGTSYPLYDFNKYVEMHYDEIKKGAKDYKINTLYRQYVTESILLYEESILPEKHEDYRMLIKEFHDGILIYDLMKKEVWDKANTDSTGLRYFYETNREKYIQESYIKAIIFEVDDLSVLSEIKNKLDNGTPSDSIIKTYNSTEKMSLRSIEVAIKRGRI